jgi:hypothetical protein
MGKVLKIALGVVLIAAGLFSYIFWYDALWTVVKGCVGIFAILAGIICFMI